MCVICVCVCVCVEQVLTCLVCRMVAITFEVVCDMTAPEEKVLIIGNSCHTGVKMHNTSAHACTRVHTREREPYHMIRCVLM